MKEIIPKDDYGVFADSHDVALVDSRYVARYLKNFGSTILWSQLTRMQAAKRIYAT